MTSDYIGVEPEKQKKIVKTIHITLKGEVYNSVYGVKDIKNIVDIFNEVQGDCMRVEIVSTEEIDGIKK